MVQALWTQLCADSHGPFHSVSEPQRTALLCTELLEYIKHAAPRRGGGSVPQPAAAAQPGVHEALSALARQLLRTDSHADSPSPAGDSRSGTPPLPRSGDDDASLRRSRSLDIRAAPSPLSALDHDLSGHDGVQQPLNVALAHLDAAFDGGGCGVPSGSGATAAPPPQHAGPPQQPPRAVTPSGARPSLSVTSSQHTVSGRDSLLAGAQPSSAPTESGLVRWVDLSSTLVRPASASTRLASSPARRFVPSLRRSFAALKRSLRRGGSEVATTEVATAVTAMELLMSRMQQPRTSLLLARVRERERGDRLH